MAFAALALSGTVNADILITQVTPLTGPVARDSRESTLGVKVYFDAVNAAGGVGKQKLRQVVVDDQYKPDETIRLMRKAAGDATLAFVLPLGSPALTKVLQEKILDEIKVPVVGAIPGAEPLRNPGSRYLFHVRAGDKAQIDRIVEQALIPARQGREICRSDACFGSIPKASLSNSPYSRAFATTSRRRMVPICWRMVSRLSPNAPRNP